MQVVEDLDGAFGVEHGRLGHLDRQTGGRQAAALQGGRDHVDETGLGELPRGHVDADPLERVRAVLGPPVRGLQACRPQDPGAQLDDEAVLLGHQDEVGRPDQAAFRVVPAHKRLDGDHPAVGQGDDRLVDEAELAGVERGTQLRPGAGLLARVVVELGRVPAVPLARNLRRVHRDVGAAQHLERVAGAGAVGDAGAGADEQLVLAGLDGPPERVGKPPDDGVGLLGCRPRHENREFVAAHPGHQRVRRQVDDEPPGQHGQQPIADGVTEPVVDGLEAVEVQQRRLRAPGVEGRPQLLHEAAPVRQTRQVVAHGQSAELSGLALNLRDEPGHAQHHEQEQNHRADGDRGPVAGVGADSGHEEHAGRQQRAGRQQDEPARTDLATSGMSGHRARGSHRWVQGRRRPRHVGEQPARVQQAALVGGEIGVKGDQREADVGDQEQQAGDPQQPRARGTGAGTGEEPGQDRQQQRVGGRVGRADDPLERRGRRVGRDRVQHEDPEDQPETGRDDGGVDEAGEVAAAPAAHQKQ